MPTYDLGTATVSARVAQLLKDSYERENLPEGETAEGAQILGWVRRDLRNSLAYRAQAERRGQREAGVNTEDAEIDNEVTVE